ncbi:MAG: hypothetical protein J6D25_01130 [Eggerthellaceae bacterium]|nr:hypothetical protein [Eggerthellaceae bacterium]
MEATAAMVTLGDLRAATAGMEDDLCLSFALDVLGKTIHCRAVSVERVDDPYLGFDEAAFEMSVDPDEIAGDEKLMAELAERKEMLEGYYESLC